MCTRSTWAFAAMVLVGFPLTVATAQAQDKEKIALGAKLYAANKCTQCHSIEGKGTAVAKKGPLDGVGDKLSEDEIRQWIVDAPGMTKKTKATRKPVMKNYEKLPKEEVDALVAYMKSLKKG